MSKINRAGTVMWVDGYDIHSLYEEKIFMFTIASLRGATFRISFEKDGITYYEGTVWFTREETHEFLLKEAEYFRIRDSI